MKSLYRIGNALKNVVWRYPLPLLSAFFAFVLAILMIGTANSPQSDITGTQLKLFLEALSAMLLFFTADILAIWFRLDKAKRFGFYLLVFCALGVHYYSINPNFIESPGVLISRYAVFFLLYFLLLTSITFVTPGKDAWFWQYNYRLIQTLIQSVGFTVVLLIGVVSAFWAIDNLFGMGFNEQYYGYIVAFMLIIVHAILFLLFFPEGPHQIQPDALYPNWLRIFSQYILLPLVLLYGSFLYIYVMKILMVHRMPNGWIASPILIYSGSGLLAYTLLFPLRNQQENRVAHAFIRFFFFTLLPLLTFYFLALYLRIKPYGFTESRYIMLMIGIWLSGISIYRIIKPDAPLMMMSQSLLLCILLSVIGPWGMYQVSIRSQTNRLKKMFYQEGFFVHKSLDFRTKHNKKITEERFDDFQSILSFLNDRNQLKQLSPWLNASDQRWLSELIAHKNYRLIERQLFQGFNINSASNENVRWVLKSKALWGTNQAFSLSTAGFLYLLDWQKENVDLENSIQYALTDKTLTMIQYQDTICSISLERYLQQVKLFKQENNAVVTDSDYLVLPDSLTNFQFNQHQLYINELEIALDGNATELLSIKGYWFVSKP